MGDELRPVVAADVRRCQVEAGQRLQHGHHVLGLATPTHSDRQAEAAVLVDHVEEFEPPAIDGGVELEVHGPDLVREFGLVTPHRAIVRTSPLLLARSRPLQTLLAPEPMHPLVVYQPTLAPQSAVCHPPAPADVLSSDFPEATPELDLLNVVGQSCRVGAGCCGADPPLGRPFARMPGTAPAGP